MLAGCTSGHTPSTTSRSGPDVTTDGTPGTATPARTTDRGSVSGHSSAGAADPTTGGDGSTTETAPPGGGQADAAAVTRELQAEVPTAASLAAAGKGLPADPVAATDALVATVFGQDEKAAVAATAELLRRAGFPLVSAGQPILALPDRNVIVNHQIPAEMVPSLTDAIRSGQRYTLDQAAQLLAMTGATEGTLTGRQLVAVLAQWGKGPGDPTESVVAGSAERALGEWHHQLLNPTTVVSPAAEKRARGDLAHAPSATIAALTDPERITGLDPLQVILLLAHLTSFVDTVADVQSAGLRRAGGALLPGNAAPASNAVCSFLDYSDTTAGKIGHGVEKNAFRQAIIQGAKIALKIAKGTVKIIGGAFAGYDVATDIMTTVLMFTGLKTQISFDKATTHFRHQPHDLSRNVRFTATLTFHSALQGDNGQYHGCWRFAGVTMPQNGGVKNWLIHWKVTGPVPVLQRDNRARIPTSGPTDALAPTDANGQSFIDMEPRREKKPPPAGQQKSYPEHMMVNEVTASPDPHLDLVKPGDIFNLGAFLVDPLAPVILEVEKMINRAVRNNLLPGATVPYPVSYHEKQPYTIKSDGFLTIPLYAGMHMSADLYSCAGPAGPWHGSITFAVAAGYSVKALEQLFGVHGTDSGQFSEPISFTLDPHSGGRQQIHIPTKSGEMGLWLQLDPQAVEAAMHATDSAPPPAVVGNGSWTFGGEDVTLVAKLLGPTYSNGLQLPVVATPLEPRCTGGTLTDDPFDED